MENQKYYAPGNYEECPRRTEDALRDDLAAASATHPAPSIEIPLVRRRACNSRRWFSNSRCLKFKALAATFTSSGPGNNLMLWMAHAPNTTRTRFLT
ncbi:hypothetical protein Pyn_36814 [Prunus yedoensis var. nudiflora]|uniref:Uncharacterized protein n=1 Tax=Prunus yedoensis var. nudiflora TaxID=2094558 RepID=A0A314UNW0_PRUYE|nr:hypothetical protein Pyn_36814 [Prunus yedoensis var. nudiflora]